MSGPRQRPVGDRPGWRAWLGPVSLALSCVSWLLPVVGGVIAMLAIVCGLVSMFTRTEFRIDWTAAAGTVVAAGQVLFSLILSLT